MLLRPSLSTLMVRGFANSSCLAQLPQCLDRLGQVVCLSWPIRTILLHKETMAECPLPLHTTRSLPSLSLPRRRKNIMMRCLFALVSPLAASKADVTLGGLLRSPNLFCRCV